jgi:hypothetical protein
MHVNWMEAQYFKFGLENSLPSLVRWPTLLDINYTKALFPLVKELLIFEYKWVKINSYSSISCEDRILENLSDFSKKVWIWIYQIFPKKYIQGKCKFEFVPKFLTCNPEGILSSDKK